MIKCETAAAIAYAWGEIAAAKKLLEKLEEAKKYDKQPDFRDAFGIPRGLQLAVPSGSGGHALYAVSPALAEIVISAHIDAKRAEIAALSLKARGEIDSSDSASPVEA